MQHNKEKSVGKKLEKNEVNANCNNKFNIF